jgi:hypothetical protein
MLVLLGPCVALIGRVSVKQSTVLTVLTQTPAELARFSPRSP